MTNSIKTTIFALAAGGLAVSAVPASAVEMAPYGATHMAPVEASWNHSRDRYDRHDRRDRERNYSRSRSP